MQIVLFFLQLYLCEVLVKHYNFQYIYFRIINLFSLLRICGT